uniref:UPF0434 protein ENU66_08435 n=1 Tax=candidate division WOR-3 bacterium TaxID=2052148 RepID=A0A7V3ZZ61_UNCW3
MPIPERLLEFICCPKCKGDLIYDREHDFLICPNCKLKYPIIDDIPVLIIEEGKPIDDSNSFNS